MLHPLVNPGRLGGGLMGLWLLLAPTVVSAQEPRLDVDAVDQPVTAILAEISANTGVVFELKTDLTTSITLKLTDEPLSSVLRQVLAEHDYLMLHEGTGSERRPSRVLVMARRASDSVAVVTEAPERPQWRELVVRRQGNQPFIVAGQINGQAVDLLIDTGATTVAVSQELAQRLGLRRGQARQINTASGITVGYTTVLQRLSVGELQLDNVAAIILPAMRSGRQVLLGMNALAEFELNQRGDTLVLRHKHSDPLP